MCVEERSHRSAQGPHLGDSGPQGGGFRAVVIAKGFDKGFEREGAGNPLSQGSFEACGEMLYGGVLI